MNGLKSSRRLALASLSCLLVASTSTPAQADARVLAGDESVGQFVVTQSGRTTTGQLKDALENGRPLTLAASPVDETAKKNVALSLEIVARDLPGLQRENLQSYVLAEGDEEVQVVQGSYTVMSGEILVLTWPDGRFLIMVTYDGGGGWAYDSRYGWFNMDY